MADMVKFSNSPAGLSAPAEPPMERSRTGAGCGLPRAWITPELVQETCAVWSRAYGRPVAEEEACEILQNVKRLAEVLISVQRGKGNT
jgi:hypothetical protein